MNNILATDLSGEYYGDLIERIYIKNANGAMIQYVKDQKVWVLYTGEGAAIARSKSKAFSLGGETWQLLPDIAKVFKVSDFKAMTVTVMQVFEETAEMPCGFEISIENKAHYAEYASGQYVEEKGLWIAGGKVYKHTECNVYAYCLDKNMLVFAPTLEIRDQEMLAFGKIANFKFETCCKLSMEMVNSEMEETGCQVKLAQENTCKMWATKIVQELNLAPARLKLHMTRKKAASISLDFVKVRNKQHRGHAVYTCNAQGGSKFCMWFDGWQWLVGRKTGQAYEILWGATSAFRGHSPAKYKRAWQVLLQDSRVKEDVVRVSV